MAPAAPRSPAAKAASTSAPLTIGAVLAQLAAEFPDISISKIRFLESEGLIAPSRATSGYRTFSDADVQRLRYILTAQRDRFWPLKVIRDALDALDRGLEPTGPDGAAAMPRVPEPAVDEALPAAADLRGGGGLRLTARELGEAAGLDAATLESLVTHGLLRADAGGHFGEGALAVARAAGALAAYGIEPRHLRSFRSAADREIGLVQQVVAPLRGRVGRGDDAVQERSREVLAACIGLHVALVRHGLEG